MYHLTIVVKMTVIILNCTNSEQNVSRQLFDFIDVDTVQFRIVLQPPAMGGTWGSENNTTKGILHFFDACHAYTHNLNRAVPNSDRVTVTDVTATCTAPGE